MPECHGCGLEVVLLDGRVPVHGCYEEFARWDDKDAFENQLESRFTDPREDCQHPERWHSVDADSTEFEVTDLVAAFVRALRPDVVVETGSAWGQTSEAIGEALTFTPGRLYTLEIDPTRAQATRVRCAGLAVEVVEQSSLDWVAPDGIGFAWLDSHFDLRVPEFERLYPHFAPGAVVGFHDTGPHRPALRAAVEGLEEREMLLPIHLPTPRGVTFGQVV
jgi:predicted O-methyltransferase YrrM